MLTFNTITASDQKLIENFVNKFLPYSDFNFVSIFSWSKHSSAKYCITNNCLFLILPDYITNKPIFTFLCDDNYRQNLNLYILWLQLNSHEIKFNLLPQTVVKGLEKDLSNEADKWILYEERDSFDYILDTRLTTSMEGNKYSDFRYKLSLFDRTYNGKIEIGDFDPNNKNHTKMALALGKNWALNRNQDINYYKDELLAYSRFFKIATKKPSIGHAALYTNKKLIALASFEIINKKYAIGHFLKFNPEYKGVYNKLVYEVCKTLTIKNINLINIEQDLGIQGLRSAKSHLRPVNYLKKYSLSLIDRN